MYSCLLGSIYNQLNVNSTSRNRALANLRKLSDDTQTIHSLIKKDISVMTGEKKDVFQFLLNLSSVGYIIVGNTISYKGNKKKLERISREGIIPYKKNWYKKV